MSVRKWCGAAVLVFGPGFAADAATVVSQPFQGVTWYERTETAPRNLVINIVEIDLTATGISFFTTESNGSLPGEVTGETTRGFVNRVGAQIGINGDFFSVPATGYRNLSHIAVSNGNQVSPWSGNCNSKEAALNITQNNVATIVDPLNRCIANYLTNPPVSLYTTVAGNERLIRNGNVVATDNNLHPRTAVGVSGSKLFLFVVDGRQTGYSEGMTTVEIANMLKNDYGVTDAVNLDGGGSTTMVFADPTARVINRPSDGTERVVGNNLAVFARLWPQWVKNSNGNWNVASNWSEGVPNAIGAIAGFRSVISAPRTITVDTPVTVGTMTFENTNRYTVAGTQPVTINAGAGAAKVELISGSHTISAPLILNDSVELNISASSTLTISGAVNNSSGQSITKTGEGSVVMNGGYVPGSGSALNVNAGSLHFIGNFGTNGGNQSINVAGTLTMPSTQRVSSIWVGSDGRMTLQSHGLRFINARSINIEPGGRLNLSNNHMVVNYEPGETSPIGTWNGSSYTGLTALIASAYNDGQWNGWGITSSFAKSENKMLGIAEASDIFGLSGSQTMMWGTELIDATTVLIKYTPSGDANLDNKINIDDYFRIDYGWINGLSGWAWGDFNYDGVVDAADYLILDQMWYQIHGTQPPAGFGPDRVLIPEPSATAMLLFAGWMMRRRRA